MAESGDIADDQAVVVQEEEIVTFQDEGTVDMKAEKKTGFISSAAGAVGKVAQVASMIPGMATIAAPVAAVAGVVGNVAAAFGFSKPTTEKHPDSIQVQTVRNFNNFNGLDLSKKLALDATNSISAEPIFGTEIDEMSLTYIAKKMNYYRSFDFTKTQSAGAVLFSTAVSPLGERQQYKDYPNTYVMTHLAYIARMFGFWSGGIKYRFRFVKTKFHSGRLRVSIVPMGIFFDTVRTFDANKCISYIIDLKEKSEFEFIVPYTYISPMMPTGFGGSNETNDGTHTTMPAHSVIVVTVLNELRTPSTLVSDTVNVIVEKGGAEDISFHVPMQIRGQVVTFDNGPLPPPPTPKTMAQSSEEQLSDGSSTPLFSMQGKFDTRLPLACVGETIVSARQLLKRFQYFDELDGDENSLIIRPYTAVDITYTNSQPVESDAVNYYDAFSSIFAFMRGGMRVKMMYVNSLAPESGIDSISLRGRDAFGYPQPTHNVQAVNNKDVNATVVNNPSRDGVLEIEVPFYNQYPITVTNTTELKQTFKQTQAMNYPSHLYELSYRCNPNFSVVKRLYRAVAEDFSFGFLVGVPPIQFFTP